MTVDYPDAFASARRFRLSDEQRAAFVDPEDPAHVAPVADMVAGIGSVLDDLAEAYQAALESGPAWRARIAASLVRLPETEARIAALPS